MKIFLRLLQISLPVFSYYGRETKSLLFNCDVTHTVVCCFPQARCLANNNRKLLNDTDFATANDFENNSGQTNTNSESTCPFSADYSLQKTGLWSDVALKHCVERTGFDDKPLQPQAEYCSYEEKIHGLYKTCLERSQNCENWLFNSFCLSFVRLSVGSSLCMEQIGSHWTDFHEIWYLSIIRK